MRGCGIRPGITKRSETAFLVAISSRTFSKSRVERARRSRRYNQHITLFQSSQKAGKFGAVGTSTATLLAENLDTAGGFQIGSVAHPTIDRRCSPSHIHTPTYRLFRKNILHIIYGQAIVHKL
jgi:hypothetical protein